MKRRLRRLHHAFGPADRGSMALAAALIMVPVFWMLGIVADGGANNTFREEATDIATQAARAGADELDLGYLRTTGIARLDTAAAEAAATSWLRTTGYTGRVDATVEAVTVEVEIDQPLILLRTKGVNSLTVTATATAAPRTGVNEPNDFGSP